jgi:hypothetical protein
VFLRNGRVRVADAEDVNLSPHAVEIRLRRRDPADRTPDLDVFPWGEVARVYVGIAAMRQGQWLPEVDVAEKDVANGRPDVARQTTTGGGSQRTPHLGNRYLPPLAGPLVHDADGLPVSCATQCAVCPGVASIRATAAGCVHGEGLAPSPSDDVVLGSVVLPLGAAAGPFGRSRRFE